MMMMITIVNADERWVMAEIEPNGKLGQKSVKFPSGSIPGVTPSLSG